ncbi:MAG: glycosyltransferase [Lyngbya sp.]|nr:glycosyltransferase [Lyngbya sp.]
MTNALVTEKKLTEEQPEYQPENQTWIGMLLISAFGLFALIMLRDPAQLSKAGLSGLVGMGILGLWRWSWFMVQVVRSRLFMHVIFPRWREKASQIPVEDLPHMCFMIPTYKEKMWVTERVFKAIVEEAKTLAQPITVMVNSSGDEENAVIRQVIEEYDPGLKHINLYQLTQKEGKRKAMADGLRELRTYGLPEDTIVALMDGDSELCPGTLRGCLPFFRMFPKLGALTTDETPIVKGSYIFSEWFHLRFAQRHYQMCSLSLSRKVLCLTGRFSLFHSRAAFDTQFIDQLQNDSLDDWLWGRFKFLSGDDKSTWFSLLRWRYEMIYVPDVMVNSLETHSGDVLKRAYSNMRRWFGNMLRSSGRAIGLGPRAVGLFPWWCLLDQRISMWTSLITPGLLLISLLTGNWLYAGIIVSWVCFSRPLMLLIIFMGRPSHLKPIHFPILVATQWSSAVIKVWNQMNMAQQSWQNRGIQTITADSKGLSKWIQILVSRFLLTSQVIAFFVALLWWWFGILTPFEDVASWWNNYQTPPAVMTTQIIDATDHGIYPNDNQDDAQKLQALIDSLPPEGKVEINLPIGEIDFYQPIEITRSQTVIGGQGAERTIIQARFNAPQQESFFRVLPPMGQIREKIAGVQLRGFTLRHVPQQAVAQASKLNGVILERAKNATIRDLNLTTNGHPVILNQTKNVTVEFVTVRGTMMEPMSLNEPSSGDQFSAVNE